MPTREAIDAAAHQLHRELTHSYYSDPEGFPGGKAAFDTQHAAIWAEHEAQLLAEGLIEPAPEPGPTIDELVARIVLLEAKTRDLG